MTDETITDITDATSRTLYECGSGALRLQSIADTTVKGKAFLHDGHESTKTRTYPGSTGSVFVDRSPGVAAE